MNLDRLNQRLDQLERQLGVGETNQQIALRVARQVMAELVKAPVPSVEIPYYKFDFRRLDGWGALTRDEEEADDASAGRES